MSEASRTTLSVLCLFLVPSGVRGMVSVLAAGLMSIASCPLAGDEDLEVPTLLDDEEDEDTVALLFGSFFFGFSVFAA